MDDLRAQLERALAGSYTFERELGGGGMSRTYLVREKALDRRVVVKVLAPELLAGISVERFRREVLLAAQLQHPHVVPVLTAGDTNGLPWFTMPYVDGDSLRQRLADGPMGIGEIVGILRDVARALAYAHGHGVVHRDIKPDNVLLSAGSATVTDFGIAKAINAARGTDGGHRTELTIAGTSIGTPTYMAPEQAAGDPETDHRADLYGLGCTMYFMLTGHPPFPEGTIAQRIAKHQKEMPKEIRKIRPECPGELEGICWKLMQKDPKFRYSSAAQTAEVLEAWLAKNRIAAAVGAGGNSSLNLGDEHDRRGSQSQSGSSLTATVDTVSNRSGDTLSGKSGSSILNLSTSDSGVLVRIAKNASASNTSSQIDLESEIARRSQLRGGSSAHGNSALSATARGASSIVRGKAPTAHPAQPLLPANPPIPTAGGQRVLWIVGLAVMFILAVLLGVFIAYMTLDRSGPPSSLFQRQSLSQLSFQGQSPGRLVLRGKAPVDYLAQPEGLGGIAEG